MPNPEQNKWEEQFEREFVATGAHIEGMKRIEYRQIREHQVSQVILFIHSLLSQTRQQTINEIEKTIKARLKYCQEQNGLPYCKNCGLNEKDIERLK